MLSKQQILNLSGVLATASITAVGFAVGGEIGAAIMGGIGVNLSSNIIQSGAKNLKEKWLGSTNGILNHDIQQALVRAFIKSLSSLEEKYFALEETKELSKEKKKAIKSLFQELENEAQIVFLPSIEKAVTENEIKSYLYADPQEARNALWERIDETKLIYSYYGEHFKNFLRDNCLDEIVFWFGKELETDNKENNKAWRAFQRMLLEGIQADVKAVKASQDVVKRDLKKLDKIRKQLDEIKNTIDHRLPNEPFQESFINALANIKTTLQDVAATTERIEEKQDTHIEITKGIAAEIKKLSGVNVETGIPEVLVEDDSTLPEEVKEKIEEAKIAQRLGKHELSTGIWNEVGKTALEANNQELSIRIRLEIALLQVQDDLANLGNALKIAEECLVESKKIKLGNQVGRILQLLGEFHRLNRDTDKAKGFMKASLEFSKARKDKNSEAWTLLSMAMLSKESKEPVATQLDYTRKAYDLFTSLHATGEKKAIEQANDGYATCHLQRAESYGYERFDEALAEYSQAIAIYRQMGESWEFQLARILLDRGEMQARRGDTKQGLNDIIKASEIFKGLGNHYMEAKCVMVCAELLDARGVRKQSETYFKLALQIVSLIPNERKKGWFYLRYGMKLLELGEHDKAKELLQWLVSSETTTDAQKLDVLRILSDLAKATKNAEELKEYEEYSLSIIEVLIGEATSPNERLHLLYKKGHTLEGLEKYESALETFHRAIRLAETMSSKERLADCWSSIAKVNAEMNNPKEERFAYEQVLKIVGDDESSPQLAATLMMLAQMEMKESNFKEANELLDRSEKLCKKVMPFLMFAINDIRQRLKEAESIADGDK